MLIFNSNIVPCWPSNPKQRLKLNTAPAHKASVFRMELVEPCVVNASFLPQEPLQPEELLPVAYW
jgi:hypothetical protein